MTVPPLAPAAAHAMARHGDVVLLDIRPARAFTVGHPRGALSIPFSARGLGPRARAALPPGVAVLLVAPDTDLAEAAVAQLTGAGVAVRGTLAGGFDAWRAADLPEATTREVALDDLPRLCEVATVIDVREPLEWATGYVPGALLIPLGQLRASLGSIPRDRPVIAICEAGVRSCTAASILSAEGLEDVAHVPDGSGGYRRAGLPLAYPNEEALAR